MHRAIVLYFFAVVVCTVALLLVFVLFTRRLEVCNSQRHLCRIVVSTGQSSQNHTLMGHGCFHEGVAYMPLFVPWP